MKPSVKPSKGHDLSSPAQLFWFTLSVGWQRHLSTFHQAKAAKDMPSPAQVVASKLNFTPFSTSNPPFGSPSLRSEAMARWWPGVIRQLVGTARSAFEKCPADPSHRCSFCCHPCRCLTLTEFFSVFFHGL